MTGYPAFYGRDVAGKSPPPSRDHHGVSTVVKRTKLMRGQTSAEKNE